MNEWPAVERAVEAASARRSSMRRPGRRWRHALKHRFPPGVYVLGYHAVADARDAAPWELAYDRVLTPLERFREHLGFLSAAMVPVRLTQLPELLAHEPLREPCFALTFDDGFANLVEGAASVCAEHGVEPTVFVCADFASARSVSYRVLLALLESEGDGAAAARVLNEHLGRKDFRDGNLLAASKSGYLPGAVEEAALSAWTACRPGVPLPQAHLGWSELRDLKAAGWSVGNHTLGHRALAGLTGPELEQQVVANMVELAAEGLDPIPWLAYPQGCARHVHAGVADLLGSIGQMGIFCGGGVNLVASGTEWLRIPLLAEPLPALRERLYNEVFATREALRRLRASAAAQVAQRRRARTR